MYKINKYGFTMQHISDTHGQHWGLNVGDVDVIIHSGDESNNRNPITNFSEFEDFVDWYSYLSIPIKILIAGNHSSFIAHNQKEAERILRDAGIEYLNKNSITIYGCTIYGDPMTPRFGDWDFMADRSTINKHWGKIPIDTNILVTHGPPKGILDVCEEFDRGIKLAGDSALGKRINKLPNLDLVCFGHIHDNNSCINTGIRLKDEIVYSNAAAVKDGRINKGIHYHGNYFFM